MDTIVVERIRGRVLIHFRDTVVAESVRALATWVNDERHEYLIPVEDVDFSTLRHVGVRTVGDDLGAYYPVVGVDCGRLVGRRYVDGPLSGYVLFASDATETEVDDTGNTSHRQPVRQQRPDSARGLLARDPDADETLRRWPTVTFKEPRQTSS